MALEIPTWAWTLIVLLLGGGGGWFLRIVNRAFERLEEANKEMRAALDETRKAFAAMERRMDHRSAHLEGRVIALETKEALRRGNRTASGL